jgi:hypothetical protein
MLAIHIRTLSLSLVDARGNVYLKGTVSRDFSSPVFFHETTSPDPNGHAYKRFRFFSNIRGVIRIRN